MRNWALELYNEISIQSPAEKRIGFVCEII